MIYYIRNEVDNLIGFEYNNNIYYYIKNIQEDIIGIIDSNDNNITDTTHIGYINPFRYRSYYYDKETNLYYLNSRYYNPVWGRFINADGIVGANQDILSYNLYAYCSNNPVNCSEPSGMFVGDSIVNFTNEAVSNAKLASKENVIKKTNHAPNTFRKVDNPKCSIPDYSEEINRVLNKNEKEAKISSFVNRDINMIYFYESVKSGARWDYKLKKNWENDFNVPYLGNDGLFLWNGNIISAEDFGNIHYGYIGKSLGISDKMLYIGGGYARIGLSSEIFVEPYYGDDINDHFNVKKGIDLYNELH